MLSQRPQQTAYIQTLLDAAMLCLAFFIAFAIRGHVWLPFLEPPAPLSFAAHFWLLAIGLPLYWALTRGSESTGGGGRIRSLRRVATTFLYLGLLLGTAIFLFQAKGFSRAVFFLFLVIGFALVAGCRILLPITTPRIRSGAASRRNLLVVGLSKEALAFREKIESHPELHTRIVGHLAGPRETPSERPGVLCLGTLDDLKHIVEEQVVDDVVFVVPASELPGLDSHFAWCEEVGITVHLKVDFVRTLLAKTYPTELDGIPMLTLACTPRDPAALLLKRVVDLGVSTAALVLLAPVFLLVALAVKLTSRGPLIFGQQRVGLYGRRFTLYKFRSMYNDAEQRKDQLELLNEMDGPVFKIRQDPRVTPVGRWLRKFSIDELPQLWNVLRGDMSLVGPRPPLAEEVQRYQRWQRRRLSMKPGITCLWQVSGRNRIAFDEWMKLDLEYIDNWSLQLDLKILLRTVPAVVTARGAR